jgi:quinoprotein glucose dehydrogenase
MPYQASRLRFLLLLALFSGACRQQPKNFSTWEMVNGNSSGNKYSSLAQIDTANVQRLQVAWTYHTGDVDTASHSQIQCNPIVINGTLYGTSPQLKLFALDAATGKEKWTFSPFDERTKDKDGHYTVNSNRGVAYWTDGKGDERLFYTAGSFLQAIDANTGRRVESFGNRGIIDLHDSLGVDVHELSVTATSAPTIYRDLVITGTRVSEAMDAAPGHVRAYDVRTGKMKWIFHTIPQPGEPGYESWEDPNAWKHTGGANNWMGMTIDQERGIAYVPIGSASMDFYGGKRRGDDLYADCLLALDAATGKLIWHFQYIHHDTWDYDPSSAPVLLTVSHDGKRIDAVAQTTKTGFVFLFDRVTGQSLFPIVETPVDTATDLVGEKLSPTQPFPQKPKPFVNQEFTEKDINPYLSKEEYQEVKDRVEKYHGGRIFTPQSRQGIIVIPGFDGGGEWGGPTVDPETGFLYVNANRMAWIQQLLDIQQDGGRKETYRDAGIRLFRGNCMSCHGADRKGSGNYPSLLEVGKKYNEKDLIGFLNTGRRMMPSFQYLRTADKEAIASFILNLKKEGAFPYAPEISAADSFRQVPYNFSGYNKFVSKTGLPAIAPPWGTLTAINMNSGDFLWSEILGRDSSRRMEGYPVTGSENYGGSVVTAGGLLIIAATRDGRIRAFHKSTGKLLWEAALPAAGFATPATYEINGRQYIVIACGGGKLHTGSGDAYTAFALPE